ncbi:MAG: response regulator [Dictyoglomus sp.]|nr:response regulator [Dictyoglomus sp.]MDW8189196.1 response regulator [Dictyoglomus sp.]
MVKVFLIDDSEDFINSAIKLLEEEGIEVIGFALSGKEGIEKIKNLKPDLVFVDIIMPEMDGFSTIKEIKKINNHVKTVILTLYDNEEYKKAGYEIGANGFISKSEFFSGVKDIINKILGEKTMKTILIVDDSKTIRKMVITILSKIPNLIFEEAESGLFALEKLALKNIDLMILDLNMPDMHGLEVLKFLRSHDNYKDLPVIILTTRGDEEMRETALKEGANYYITKPFDPEVLISKVKEFLNLGAYHGGG